MRTLKFLSVLFLSSICAAWSVSGEDPRVELAGASWLEDFPAAVRQAQATGKPILLFDMVGRLDEKWC